MLKFFGSAGKLPFRETIRHLLLAIRRYSTSRQSLVANRCRLGSAGASPSHFVPVPRPTTIVPLKFGAQFLRHQLRVKNP